MFSRLSRRFSLIKSQVLREMISETWSQNDLERTWNRKSFQNGQPGSWVRRERTRSYYLNKVLNISLHVSAVSLYSNFLYHAKDRTAAETKKKSKFCGFLIAEAEKFEHFPGKLHVHVSSMIKLCPIKLRIKNDPRKEPWNFTIRCVFAVVFSSLKKHIFIFLFIFCFRLFNNNTSHQN